MGALRCARYKLPASRVRACGLSFIGRRADFDMGPGGLLTIGAGAYISDDFTARCHGAVVIGDRVFVNKNVILAASEAITIGDNTLIGPMVTIFDNEHHDEDDDIPVRDQGFATAPVHIGSNVVIGAKVTILKGVTIGDNARIGANSVVTRSIPADAVAVGAPARVLPRDKIVAFHELAPVASVELAVVDKR